LSDEDDVESEDESEDTTVTADPADNDADVKSTTDAEGLLTRH